MKRILAFLFLLNVSSGYSQKGNPSIEYHINATDSVSFITKLDIAEATKDGIYLNGYVVNIKYEEAKKLHGKTIRVTGKVTIVKGLKNESPNQPIRQGREEDAKHIYSPTIEIVKE